MYTRTLFADNEADFAFDVGVPTSDKQDTESELMVIVSWPAEMVGAYFTAIGGIFDSFEKVDEAESGALAAETALELSRMTHEKCLEAIKAQDSELITELGCK